MSLHCGGILTDENGETSIGQLYAAGECTSTGLHGANRLASNSLLEGLVFGNRIAENISRTFDEISIQSGIPQWKKPRHYGHKSKF